MGVQMRVSGTAAPTPTGRGQLARCLVACTLVFTAVLFFNGALGVQASQPETRVDQLSRDLSCLAGVAAFLALGLTGMYRPQALHPGALTGVAAALTLAGQAACAVAQAQGVGWLALAGACASGAAAAWTSLLLLLACSSLQPHLACLCLSVGMACAVPLALGVGALATGSGIAWVLPLADCLCSLGALAAGLPAAHPFFARLAAVGAPTDREVSHPEAFLPLGHRLFVFIFAFSFAYGFAMRSVPVENRTAAYALTAAAMLVVGLRALLRRTHPKADGLFQVSFALIVAGFSLAVVGDERCMLPCSAALVMGYMCFYLLMWFALSAVAMRSAADAVPAACWGSAVNYLGIVAGALLGAALDAAGQGGFAVQLTVAAVLTCMAAYMLHAFHLTSLDAAIAGIEADAKPPEVRYIDRLSERCEQAVQAHGLTAREGEILQLLARGNNARHIEEELSISHNTVKYHARNVYRKLGVHSQQELIDSLCG